MKRIWAGAVVLLSVVLMNGCSKCSHDEAVPVPPPGAETEAAPGSAPAEGAAVAPPGEEGSEELPPGDANPALTVPVPGTPKPAAGESAD